MKRCLGVEKKNYSPLVGHVTAKSLHNSFSTCATKKRTPLPHLHPLYHREAHITERRISPRGAYHREARRRRRQQYFVVYYLFIPYTHYIKASKINLLNLLLSSRAFQSIMAFLIAVTALCWAFSVHQFSEKPLNYWIHLHDQWITCLLE